MSTSTPSQRAFQDPRPPGEEERGLGLKDTSGWHSWIEMGARDGGAGEGGRRISRLRPGELHSWGPNLCSGRPRAAVRLFERVGAVARFVRHLQEQGSFHPGTYRDWPWSAGRYREDGSDQIRPEDACHIEHESISGRAQWCFPRPRREHTAERLTAISHWLG